MSEGARAMFPDGFLSIRPEISPGLAGPPAWSLSPLSIQDLDAQRARAMQQPEVMAFSKKLGGPGLS